MEADEEKRKSYLNKISRYQESRLVYIDESGIDQGIGQDRSWAPKGQTVHSQKSGKYYLRTNIIAGLNDKKPIAPFVFYGNCDTELFNAWVEHCLIKELKPNQIVIMDNAAFHKSKRTIELIESVQCKVIFLPPYSPDLNPIEKFWANMKRWIRLKIIKFKNLYQALHQYFSVPSLS